MLQIKNPNFSLITDKRSVLDLKVTDQAGHILHIDLRHKSLSDFNSSTAEPKYNRLCPSLRLGA
jgi:hypothetical protein